MLVRWMAACLQPIPMAWSPRFGAAGARFFQQATTDLPSNYWGGEQPWITSTIDGPLAVWSLRRDGDLLMKLLSKDKVHSIASNARDAVVVTDPVHGKTAFVFWEKNEKGRSSILAKTIDIAAISASMK
jgi:hypothetical protein